MKIFTLIITLLCIEYYLHVYVHDEMCVNILSTILIIIYYSTKTL